MILSEIVEMVESSNEGFYFPVEEGDVRLSNRNISVVVAHHNLMEDVPKIYILLAE